MITSAMKGRNDEQAEKNKEEVITIKEEFYADLMNSGYMSSKTYYIVTECNRETWEGCLPIERCSEGQKGDLQIEEEKDCGRLHG